MEVAHDRPFAEFVLTPGDHPAHLDEPSRVNGSIAVICMMCFEVTGNRAWVSCMGRTGTGLSLAELGCHWIAPAARHRPPS